MRYNFFRLISGDAYSKFGLLCLTTILQTQVNGMLCFPENYEFFGEKFSILRREFQNDTSISRFLISRGKILIFLDPNYNL